MVVLKSPFPTVKIPITTIPNHFLFDPIRNDPGRRNLVAMLLSETNEKITYGEVEHNVLALSAGLAALGVHKGVVVQMFGPSGPEFPQIAWAVLHAGGILTTANPAYNADELAYQLGDSKPTFMFTVPDMLETALAAAKEGNIKTSNIFVYQAKATGFKYWTELFGDAAKAPKVKWSADELTKTPAYILYSSGTTGRPKGVMQSHFNVIANRQQTSSLVPPEFIPPSGTPALSIFPMYHAAGLFIIQGMLAGGSMVITSRKFSFSRFCQAIQDYKIAGIVAPPPIYVMLAKSPEARKYDLSSLQAMGSGAAPLGKELAEEIGASFKLPSGFIMNGWGQSEVNCSGTGGGLLPPKIGSVGFPLPNSEIKLIDEDGNEVHTPNTPGEMYYKGPNVTLGYLNRDDATRETYIDGWVKTGDQIIYDDQGYLFVVDRLKELIKVNALQVAPAELEALVLSHPAVADVAVVPTPDDMAGELPRAFVVTKAGKQSKQTALDIMKFVDERVAKHKHLRGGICFVDEIPKNPSGKILRRVLRDDPAKGLIPHPANAGPNARL
ncbi:hypothetical protein SmJEL517_g04605 [Synchytrium microbalum]|uniref:4-coumarate--CoA ligase n=1 Tax=Synchytrium microbalum TaxID=1806994 RepID=A0A507BYL3_9FUNG|nr:uncharacterized protein SmJEL517_g04605 [Synchytrium microbalum]TPX32218.1 hypothetical protein SmJEL517_g04605 [Synchytrium microbalum]